MDEIQKSIIDAIKIQINEKIKDLQFDKTCYGKVVAIRDDTCDVEINGEITQCKIRNGLQINVNDIVLVRLINNDFSNKFADAKLGTVGDDVEVEIDWSDIIGKPSSSPSDIDDSVSKKHTHNNLSLLETITQTLVNAWNSAVSHISDAVKHITSDERNLWNTVANKVDKIEGKGLSTEDYTTEEKNKLAGISANANKTEGSNINGNIKIDGIETTVYTHPSTHPASIIVEDSTHRFVTDAEKDTWNNKQDSLGYTPENIANKGVANGYASLDSNGKIPLSQIPDATFNTYTYYQITPSDNWVIKHNLNRYPSVTIVDSSGNVVVGEVKYIDNNTINISLVGVFAGTAYLN